VVAPFAARPHQAPATSKRRRPATASLRAAVATLEHTASHPHPRAFTDVNIHDTRHHQHNTHRPHNQSIASISHRARRSHTLAPPQPSRRDAGLGGTAQPSRRTAPPSRSPSFSFCTPLPPSPNAHRLPSSVLKCPAATN